MKEIEKDIIFYKINNILKECFKKYGEENIFGIFTLDMGSNYCALIIPSFEDICINTPRLNEKLSDNIQILDIRYIYRATEEGFPQLAEALYTDFYLINPRYEHMYEKLIHTNRDAIKEGIINHQPAPELKLGLLKIMRTAFNDNSNVVKFIKQLTDAEKLALDQIITTIGDEGIISQYKIASSIGVSRKTVSSLIMKASLHNVAEIKYLGPKGTYFKVIDDTLLNPHGHNFK